MGAGLRGVFLSEVSLVWLEERMFISTIAIVVRVDQDSSEVRLLESPKCLRRSNPIFQSCRISKARTAHGLALLKGCGKSESTPSLDFS